MMCTVVHKTTGVNQIHTHVHHAHVCLHTFANKTTGVKIIHTHVHEHMFVYTLLQTKPQE